MSPDAIHEHVKTKIGADAKSLHYAAPEFAVMSRVETSADIYAFGICALEVRGRERERERGRERERERESSSLPPLSQMLNLDLLANGDSRRVNQESINRAMQGLNKSRKEFISACLEEDPAKRLTASALMKSRVLQEVRYLVCMCVGPSGRVVWVLGSRSRSRGFESHH